MTPKENAKELFDKYYQIFVDDVDEHFIDTSKRISKQCALIAVNEILDAMSEWDYYWEKVKEEIEKL
jgi:hypothetical protein